MNMDDEDRSFIRSLKKPDEYEIKFALIALKDPVAAFYM